MPAATPDAHARRVFLSICPPRKGSRFSQQESRKSQKFCVRGSQTLFLVHKAFFSHPLPLFTRGNAPQSVSEKALEKGRKTCYSPHRPATSTTNPAGSFGNKYEIKRESISTDLRRVARSPRPSYHLRHRRPPSHLLVGGGVVVVVPSFVFFHVRFHPDSSVPFEI